MGSVLDSDPGPLLFKLVIAFFLVLLNGFFVATEVALMNVRGNRIETLASEGNWKARIATRILRNINAYISSCRMGITVTSIGLGWLGGPLVVSMIEPLLNNLNLSDSIISVIGFLISFTIVASIHYMISEHIPKITAIQKSEQVTLWSAAPTVFFYNLMFPMVWLWNNISNGLLHKTGIGSNVQHKVAYTEDEIRELLKDSQKNGNIDHTELILVENVFKFTDTVGREIMIPRTDLTCLYADMTFEENLKLSSLQLRTRYPVCDPDKDHIIGFVHIKDLLQASQNEHAQIKSILRPLMSVPETTPIAVILKLMQKNRTEIALLIDEYGGTSGLVTIEDILEELVGEIYDEFDKDDRPSIEKKDLQTHSVDGLLNIDTFNEYFGLEIKTDDFDTIGGWLFSQLDTIPEKNQTLRYDDYELIVDEVDHQRIARIVVKKLDNLDQQVEPLSIVS